MNREQRKQEENVTLIREKLSKYAWKEQIYEDFITREEFINRTGIFVTHIQFQCIHTQWEKAKELNITLDDFIANYEKNSNEVVEVPLKGTFKYLLMDGELNCMEEYEDEDEPNIWEIINCLARSCAQEYESKREAIESYKAVLKEAVNTLEKYQMLFTDSASENPS